jgi:hypothetical protein
LEDTRAINEEDDSEDATLSLAALEDELSDLTPLEDTDESSDHDCASNDLVTHVNTAPLGQVERYRKKARSKARRKKTRQDEATSSTPRPPAVKATLSHK